MNSVLQEAIPGGWREETITIEDRIWRLVRPADPDAFLSLLDPVSGEPLDGIEPYWATVWQAAPDVARFVLRRAWRPGLAALELGAGIGLAGLAAADRGLQVTFSDYAPLAVATCLENARRNGFHDARGMLLDWRQPQAEQFSLILGADILYDWKNHEPILDVVAAMLAPAGECWIGDPGRFHTATFADKAARRGFQVDHCDVDGNVLPAPQSGQFRMTRLRHKSG